MSVSRCLAAALVPLFLAAGLSAQEAGSKLGPRVMTRLQSAGEAEIFVMLDAPENPPADLHAWQRAVTARRDAVLASFTRDDLRVQRRFAMIPAFQATVSASGLQKLLADPAVRRVDAPRFGSGALAQSVPLIRADAVHRRDDLGQGVTVAVLDTGVDPTHPDLAGSIVAEHCICRGGCCPDGSDEQSGTGSAFTTFVHGIHVTGIIVSKGIVAPRGVAPGAQVVAVKVLNDSNRGFLVDWIAALDWIATNRPDVQAINMSLVSDVVYPGTCDDADAFTMAFAGELRALRARGILTFVAAGNSAQIDAMAVPACVGAAVAVGATTKKDDVWPLSDRDSRLDVLAPGVAIVSTGPGGTTATLTGTSMAAPHMTGTAALLLALAPDLDADRLENLLKSSGVPIIDHCTGRTFPRVDALKAMNAVLDTSRPLLGGGSRTTDCLVEWDVAPEITVTHPITALRCRDGDPACDTDHQAGQCTFQVAMCFNRSDRRLPRCPGGAAGVVATRLSLPSTQRGDAVDAANAAAILGALPATPIVGENVCTAPFPFVVPADPPKGTRWIHFSARAGDGRRDYDRLRFTCVPATR